MGLCYSSDVAYHLPWSKAHFFMVSSRILQQDPNLEMTPAFLQPHYSLWTPQLRLNPDEWLHLHFPILKASICSFERQKEKKNVCVCVHRYVQVCVHVETRGQPQVPFLGHCLACFCKIRLHILEPVDQARLTGQQDSGICLFLSLQNQDHKCVLQQLDCYIGYGDRSQSLKIAQQVLYWPKSARYQYKKYLRKYMFMWVKNFRENHKMPAGVISA